MISKVVTERVPSSSDWEEAVYREVTVETYSFEDWLKGMIKTEDKPGLFLIHNSGVGSKTWVRIDIPMYVREKITLEAERIYMQRVEDRLTAIKNDFKLVYESSLDKTTFINDEILACEHLLCTDRFYSTNDQNRALAARYSKNYNESDLYKIRIYYRNMIRGIRDFTLTNSDISNNSRDMLFIKVEAFTNYLDWLYSFKKNTEKKVQFEQEIIVIHSSENLIAFFKDKKLFDECLNILRETMPPTINEANQYIGKNKAVVAVWYNAVKTKGFLKTFPTGKTVHLLLNKQFPNLNISETLTRTPGITASEYKKYFEAELSAIKTTSPPNNDL